MAPAAFQIAFHLDQAPLARTGFDGVGVDPPNQLDCPDIEQDVVVLDVAVRQAAQDLGETVPAHHGQGCQQHPAVVLGHPVDNLRDQRPPGGPVLEIRHRFADAVPQHESHDLRIEGARSG